MLIKGHIFCIPSKPSWTLNAGMNEYLLYIVISSVYRIYWIVLRCEINSRTLPLFSRSLCSLTIGSRRLCVVWVYIYICIHSHISDMHVFFSYLCSPGWDVFHSSVWYVLNGCRKLMTLEIRSSLWWCGTRTEYEMKQCDSLAWPLGLARVWQWRC